MDADGGVGASETQIIEARRLRRHQREHADQILGAENLQLDMTSGDLHRDGERVTAVQGEEAQTYAEHEQDRFEPFNLREEMQHGYFDQEGNYVRQRIDREDEWELELKQVQEETGKKVIAKKRKTLVELEDEAQPATKNDVLQWLNQVTSVLNPGETVVKALKRLCPVQKRGGNNKPQQKKQKPNSGEEQTASSTDDQVAAKAAFDSLTEAADHLLSSGFHDIYSDKREKIAASIANVAKSKHIINNNVPKQEQPDNAPPSSPEDEPQDDSPIHKPRNAKRGREPDDDDDDGDYDDV
eukprot:c11529_g1_i1.p1 GENE.c11529_g1_i1~~c11529_g1_i1.p1  ORF type:complete len:298 (+),score=74.74 c11529_g1_i1:29-922(+)